MKAKKTKDLLLLTWNLENMFHPDSGGPRKDMTPKEGWTEKQYKAKVRRVAKAIKQILNEYGKRNVPAIIGLTEVENLQVAGDIVNLLPKRFYIAGDKEFKSSYNDTILIYDSSFFRVQQVKYLQFFERFDKGEVVKADLIVNQSKDKITVFCGHLKARPYNKYYTAPYRQAVCDNLQAHIWKQHKGHIYRDLANEGSENLPESLTFDQSIVIMGDFNDEPFSSSLMDYLFATYDMETVRKQQDLYKVILYNAAWEGLAKSKPGSYFYDKSSACKWSMLDQIIFSPSFLLKESPFRYEKGGFKVVQDMTADEKGRPFSSCTWNEEDELIWTQGFSDHFPVVAKISYR